MKPSITVPVRHWRRIRVFYPRRTLSTRPFESSGSCRRRPTAFLALIDEVLASSRLPAGVHGGPEVAVVDLAGASPGGGALVPPRARPGGGARPFGGSGSPGHPAHPRERGGPGEGGPPPPG